MYIIKLLIAWVLLFFMHEVGHLMEARRQTGIWGGINFDFFYFVPTMYVSCVFKDRDLFLMAGGMWAAFVGFLWASMAILINIEWAFAFFVVAAVNFIYSWYEVNFTAKISYKKYMIGHYLLYFVVLIPLNIAFYVVK